MTKKLILDSIRLAELRNEVFGEGTLVALCSLREIHDSIVQFDRLSEWYAMAIEDQLLAFLPENSHLMTKQQVRVAKDLAVSRCAEITKRMKAYIQKHRGETFQSHPGRN